MKTGNKLPINRRRRGFTLVEVMLAVTGIILVLAAGFVGYAKVDENQKANAVVATVAAIRTATATYMDDHGGFLPCTESTTLSDIPTTGTANATATLVSNAATLETVLMADRSMDKPLNLQVGPNLTPSGTGTFLPWNNSTQTFTNTTATTWSNQNCNHVECFIATTTATPLTASPVGSSYLLDGVNTLSSGKKVVTLIIPNCPAGVAYRISRKIDGDTLSSSSSTADSTGAVIYAAPSGGATTVYVYVRDL